MKRSEKLALLRQALAGNAPRRSLQEALTQTGRGLVIIDDLDRPEGEELTDDCPVHFFDRDERHEMTLGEAYVYAQKHRITAFIILPDNGRNDTYRPSKESDRAAESDSGLT